MVLVSFQFCLQNYNFFLRYANIFDIFRVFFFLFASFTYSLCSFCIISLLLSHIPFVPFAYSHYSFRIFHLFLSRFRYCRLSDYLFPIYYYIPRAHPRITQQYPKDNQRILAIFCHFSCIYYIYVVYILFALSFSNKLLYLRLTCYPHSLKAV